VISSDKEVEPTHIIEFEIEQTIYKRNEHGELHMTVRTRTYLNGSIVERASEGASPDAHRMYAVLRYELGIVPSTPPN
jgi:hypothetical protein